MKILSTRSSPKTLVSVFSLVAVLLVSLSITTRAVAQNTGLIIITEIMYNPAGQGRDGEYIELRNTQPGPIDLSGWFFSRGVHFVFPDGFIMDGNQTIVIGANPEHLENLYDINNVLGPWGLGNCDGEPGADEEGGSGCSLANGGEVMELSEHNGVVHARVRYNDRGKWPAAGDGTGHSIGLDYSYNEPDDPDFWQPEGELEILEDGTIKGGSPGRVNARERSVLPVMINEGLLWSSGERYIELYNDSDEEVDVSFHWIYNTRDLHSTTGRGSIPQDTVIAPRGVVALTEAQLNNLDLSPVAIDDDTLGNGARRFVMLVTPERKNVIDAYIFQPEVIDRSESRIPDGDEDREDRAVPTPGEPNRVDVETDIVINEIMFHPLLGNAGEDDAHMEFLELYNRSQDRTIDISDWRFTSGINYHFPAGTRMAPDSYIVVARDPQYIIDTYGLDPRIVFGPDPEDADRFGRLRDDGERVNLRDTTGTVVDTVRYHDGGQWPDWADGRGSSIELIDARQDNNIAASWDASDDSHKAEPTVLSYQGRYNSGEPELQIMLLQKGITIVDDLRMVERVITFEPDQTFVGADAKWKLFRGLEEPGGDDLKSWTRLEFNDGAWEEVTAPVGFGEGEVEDGGTTLDDMRGNYISFYLRTEFELTQEQIDNLKDLQIANVYDDGYMAYLNGELITVQNIRTDADRESGYRNNFDDRARSSREKQPHSENISKHIPLLKVGRNVFAVQTHNASITSSDARAWPKLESGEFVPSDSDSFVGNGDFEEAVREAINSPGTWKIQGTHVNSGRTDNPSEVLDGSGSLKLIARGKGDYKVNRLEHTLMRPLRSGNTYNIEFTSRWVVGSRGVLTRGFNHDFAKSQQLNIPRNLGTPGEINSVTARQIEKTGSPNIGPVIENLRQNPPLPTTNQPVEISCRVKDVDGIENVTIFWSLDDGRHPDDERLNSVAMEGPNGEGRYVGTIPGNAARRNVVFFIVATDSAGLKGRYPNDPTERTHPTIVDRTNPRTLDRSYCIYRTDTRAGGSHPSYRFWISRSVEQYLNSRMLLSNDKVEGSFLYGNQDMYYNSQVRFSGSPWARQRWSESYRVRMPKDNPLHGRLKKFGLEDHQGDGARDGRERISNYLIRHNQGDTRAPFGYQWLVQWNINRGSSGINEIREHYIMPDVDFLSRWFPGDSFGSFFEMDDRFTFNDSGQRASNRDGRLTYPPYPQGGVTPDSPEAYRYFFTPRLEEDKDDFTHLINWARLNTTSQTPNDVYDDEIYNQVNVDAMLRVLAIRLNTDDWDTWGARRGKNCYVYRGAIEGRWYLFPWDMELTYGDTNAFPLPSNVAANMNWGGGFAEIFRMLNRPHIRRQYYGILWDMVNHQFNGRFLQPYMTKLQRRGVTKTNLGNPNGWIDRRKNTIISRVRASSSQNVNLEIRTNDGEDFEAQGAAVQIVGRAPVDMSTILVTINGSSRPGCDRASFSRSNALDWFVNIPLLPGENDVSVLGFNSRGEILGTDGIKVTANLSDPPAIETMSPMTVDAGDWVHLSGSGFHAGVTVTVGDTEITELDCTGAPLAMSFRVPEDMRSGDYDVVVNCEGVGESNAVTLTVTAQAGDGFIRGDVDNSGSLNVSDVTQTLLYLFSQGEIACEDAADVDDNGVLNLTDPIILLNFLFRRGIAPSAPFPEAGRDPTADELNCSAVGA